MDRKVMYVCALLLALFAVQGDAIKCFECVNQPTNEACEENGEIKDCVDYDRGDDTCSTYIATDMDGNPSITKACAIGATAQVCEAVDGLCLGIYEASSICACCCSNEDKCNIGLCGQEEEVCVPSSKSGSSKKSGSNKSGDDEQRRKRRSKSKKSGSKKSGSKVSCESSGTTFVASPFLLLSAIVAKFW